MFGAGLAAGSYKSGGFGYLAEDNTIPMAFHFNSTTRRNLGVGVPCRAMDKVSDELKPFCASFLDPDRPGWYAIHRDGFLFLEPEYDPTNTDTFDVDASLIFKADTFFPGFSTIQLVSSLNHYITGNTVRVAEFQDTPEFKDAASVRAFDYSTKGEWTACVYSVLTSNDGRASYDGRNP